ncbi:MAG: aldose 1-epimerase [Alphaproteobacteria bacterium]
MTLLINLEDERSRIRVAPELGGGVAAMEALRNDAPVPVMRPWDGSDSPFALGCNVLAPFSNRIAGGGFTHDGVFHEIAPNLDGEPYPIHGDGFQRAWDVVEASPRAVHLVLRDGAIGPFRYRADLTYRLDAGRLSAGLTLANTGERRLPFGGGFHPWFPRRIDTRLQFHATGLWLEDARHLPTEHVGLGSRPDWDFATARRLPREWINNAFTGWPGRAVIRQPETGLVVEITGSDKLSVAIVFSPDERADFFCFEPVSHAVDAHNQPQLSGLTELETGETMAFSMSIGWRDGSRTAGDPRAPGEAP